MGAVACAIRHRPVSHPRSSNRTCGFPASGFPTGFIVGIRREKDTSVIRVFPPPWRHDTAFSDGSRPHEVLDRLAPSHRPSPSSKAHQKSGPFPPPELPGLSGTTTLSDTHPRNRPTTAMRPLPSREGGAPPITQITLPTCRAHYPGGSKQVHVSVASLSARPSPLFGRVGIHTFTFEACSGFTRVTARWIAQPPEAAFVAGLRPGRLPDRPACQLPDQPTTLWTEPPSVGDLRRRGAPNMTG